MARAFRKTELKRIFKRFYRVPGPLAARVKGTGLGLYIVRSVAKRHGGRAWAESEGPGRGSTFVLQFPYRQDEPDSGGGRRAAPGRWPALQSGSGRIPG